MTGVDDGRLDDGDRPVRVGVLGCGIVGGALVQLLTDDAALIASRTGLRLEVARVAVRNTARDRSVAVDPSLLTADAESVVLDPDVDVVVELIGGIEPARGLILAALKAGKPVVTANKELMANVGAELLEAASTAGLDLLYEASVGGGIPLIRPLRESLAGEHITRVSGIVNGTTNYILTRMTEAGAGYQEALAEAQGLGFAERDPTADVEGYDASAKAAILASIAFGVRVVAGDVYREGISGVTADDIAVASRLGYVVKLLAVAEQFADKPGEQASKHSGQQSERRPGGPDVAERSHGGAVGVRVHPAMVPAHHPLASVRESFNAVFIEGDAVGELMLYGRGAGGRPTASAVMGDLIDASHNLRAGAGGRATSATKARIRPIDEMRSEYYLSIDVVDRPGVLAAVAGVLARHDVSIRSMEQDGLGDEARLVFITHEARERDMQATLHDLRELEAVDRIGSLMRVIGG